MPKQTIIERGMEYWFQDIKTIKIFKLGIILVTILIWVLIPIAIIRLFYSAYIGKSLLPLVLGIIITYSFFGILKALQNVNKMLKSMMEISEEIEEQKKQ